MQVGSTYTVTNEGYEIFKELGGELDLKDFKEILFDYNKQCIKHVIEDSMYFPFGGYMGGIRVVRQDRNYRTNANAAIDWKASNDLRRDIINRGSTPMSRQHPEGEPWLIRFSIDDDQYVLVHWNCHAPANRASANINRVLVYKFIPSRGKVGVKTYLKNHIYSNPLGMYKYPHVKDLRQWSTKISA